MRGHISPITVLSSVGIILVVLSICTILFRHLGVTQSPESSGCYITLATWSSHLAANSASYSAFDSSPSNSRCTMGTCFDYSRCMRQFKVFVYPQLPSDKQHFMTLNYVKIISALNRSKWLTTDPKEACLFIPRLDSLNRDQLGMGFDAHLQQKLIQLPYWYRLPQIYDDPHVAATKKSALSQPGRNHLLFNFYSGSWPYYREDQLNMLTGQAIIAKASASTMKMRTKFDISLPLFGDILSERHALTKDYVKASVGDHLHGAVRRPVLLSFKGKRYVVGFGSTTRNALFHLHNNRDIVLLTTCRHGNNWMNFADSRCPADMELYDRYDYNELLRNSTFCLVPRGRRLGSFRFLEVLEASCIPVLLSNDFELPFSEVIDWREVVIWGDERLIFLLPLMLRRIPDSEIIQRRQRIAFLWFTYFNSAEAVVYTTIEIIRDRVNPQPRGYIIWNSPPGALVFSHRLSSNECLLPLPKLPSSCAGLLNSGFTVIIPIRQSLCQNYEYELERFARSTLRAPSIRKILLVWMCSRLAPSSNHLREILPQPGVDVECVVEDEYHQTSISDQPHSPDLRFQPFVEIPTLAVFAFTLELDLAADQLEFAYSLWRDYPHRLVGFQTASHQWDPNDERWRISMGTNQNQTGPYSIAELTAAFYHRYYHNLYWQMFDKSLREIVNTMSDCEDLLMNLLIAHTSRTAPMKVAHPHHHNSSSSTPTRETDRRNICLQAFSERLIKLMWPSSYELELDPSVVQHSNSGSVYLPLYKSMLHYYQSNDVQ